VDAAHELRVRQTNADNCGETGGNFSIEVIMRAVWTIVVILAAFHVHCACSAQAQNSKAIYMSITDTPSVIRWCLPEAGDDPAKVISTRCSVYRECLANLGLDEKVDRRPYPSLSAAQVEALKKCHQALYNAARSNPQIQGSKATQKWLEDHVLPGSEAKIFPVPASFPEAR
jgi:hypothetical protein